jgi:hypothetical protein
MQRNRDRDRNRPDFPLQQLKLAQNAGVFEFRALYEDALGNEARPKEGD